MSGLTQARRRTEAVDRGVRALFAPVEGSVAALAALGGYGRAELTPGSDIDLLFLHPGRDDHAIRSVVDAVLYPLWDAGMRVSHAVRTPEECREESRKGLPTLTSLLDARFLAGATGLVDRARGAAFQVAREDPRSFADRLLAEQIEREGKFGTAWRTLEPDLKLAVGGLRDLQVLRWTQAIDGVVAATQAVQGALEFLLLVRTALHLVAGSDSNRLLAEHQKGVAGALGYSDANGWEAPDALMRDVFDAARRVHAATLELSPERRRDLQPSTVQEFLRISMAEPGFLRGPMATESVSSLPTVGPAWLGVKGRPQRDPYHRYPVDVHLLETLSEAIELVRHPQEPFAAEAVRSLVTPEPLLLAGLLHDIGKVGSGSHVSTGARIIRQVLEKMAGRAPALEDVPFLVDEHLLLSDTATRRNIEDEDLVVQMAARIGTRRRLALLYLLTVADAMATGPTASTPWRMALIRDLVAKLDHLFERGQMDRDRAARLAAAAEAARSALAAVGKPRDQVDAFLSAVPAEYLLWFQPKDPATHIDLVVPPPGGDELRVDVGPGRSSTTYRVSVGAVDRLGLLAAVSGSFTLAGLSILSAQAFTTEDGIALDVFEVRGAFEEFIEERRWDRFRSIARQALAGNDLTEKIRSLRSHYRPAERDVPVSVSVEQNLSDFSTVVEVGGPDRLGLLYDLAQTFSDHGLDVHVAKVATYGPRVVDVFYVRDEEGEKVEDPDLVSRLVRALAEAASGR